MLRTFGQVSHTHRMLSSKQRHDFLILLRMMSKKGFYDILNYIHENHALHYNEVLRYALEKKIIDSRASVTIILNGLTNLGLLERIVTNSRPIRTNYKLSKKGQLVLNELKDLEINFYK
ncbi:MAG: hypothetical protein HY295_01370 [Thaumarchaeota archaeon]|nr:hypothetical protein [Nitrososphaerota archaeon]